MERADVRDEAADVMDSVEGGVEGDADAAFSEPPAEPSLQDDLEADGAAPASVEEGASAGNHFASERVEELHPDEESADGGAGGASYSDGGADAGEGAQGAPSDAEDAEEGAPAASRADDMFSEDAPLTEVAAGDVPEGGAGETGAAASAAAAFRRAADWTHRHVGVSVLIGCVAASLVVAGGFALAAQGLMAQVDADVEARAAERLEQEGAVDPLLPYIDMRFTSFSRAGFPTVSAGLQFSMPDGSPLPGLAPEQFSLVEVDDQGTEVPVGLAGFTFDPASGACQMSYTADTAQLTGSRTVKVSLSPESGYRGGASMSYRI